MARWRIAVGVGIVVALAVVAAFVVSSVVREEPEVAADPVVAPASPSPTATDDPDPMPELQNTGEDFDQIIRSIEEFRNWLYRNPDPDLAHEIYHEDCECMEEFRRRLQLLLDDGVRFEVSTTTVHDVSILDRDPEAVAVKVVDEGDPQVLVDAETGEIVDRGSGWEPRAYRFLLVRVDGSWRVADIQGVPMDLTGPSSPAGNS